MDKSALFNEQLKAALSSEEIVAELRKIDIAGEYLEKSIRVAEPQLWQQLESEERHAAEAETALEAARNDLTTAQNELAAGQAVSRIDIILNRISRSRREDHQRLMDERNGKLATRQQQVTTAEGALTIATDSLMDALQQSILGFIRASVGDIFGPSYSTQLRITYAPGLSEVFDPRYEVSTLAARELKGILSIIRGGSIGLAGLRGSGKSTLIESVCTGRLKPLDSPIIALQVSAPVEYEPRDFVLHLFARLCDTLTGPTAYRVMEADETDEGTYERYRIRLFRQFALLVSFVIGLIFIGTATLHIIRKTPAWFSSLPSIVIGFVIPLAVFYASRLPWGAVRRSVNRSLYPRLEFSERERPITDLTQSERAIFDALRRRALELLEEIRYQQTFTAGWSGTLAVPIISVERSGEESWARQTMSYPEVIARLRNFLRDIAVSFRPIVVGIDELDKMESGDQARKFLNEIKGIFGISGCYFLVSVSVDAMSSFERRGMPFRDAFDSSFDDIVTVSPLTYEDARVVISRRVIGVANQFIALAYVISGGLTRDLIRAMRKQVTLVNDGVARSLQSISSRLVADEVSAKLAAVEIALQRDSGSSSKALILEATRGLRPEDGASLCEAAYTLRAFAPPPQESGTSSAKLASELAAYMYFAATIVQYFNDSLNAQRLQTAENSGLVDELAQCRQAFVMGAAAAWQKTREFRIACQLDSF